MSSRVLTREVIPIRAGEWRSTHFRSGGAGSRMTPAGRGGIASKSARAPPAGPGRLSGGFVVLAIVVPVQSATRREGDPPFQGRLSPCIFVLARGGTEQPNKAGPEVTETSDKLLEVLARSGS